MAFNESSAFPIATLNPADSNNGRSLKLSPTTITSSFFTFNNSVNLLNTAKQKWAADLNNHRFYHVSTDEVYGSLGAEGLFTEETAYDPRSPYSASKASSDHFVRAYHETYHLQTVISNCSNNYGPFHFPEKLIPLFINNIIQGKPLPVYGDGLYTRDWLYVKDHAIAIDMVFHKGVTGETYNIGSGRSCSVLDLWKMVREFSSVKPDHLFATPRKGEIRHNLADIRKVREILGVEFPKHFLERALWETFLGFKEE